MLEVLAGIPGWLGSLISVAIGSIGTLAIQWLKKSLTPWESDRIRFERISEVVDPVALNDLSESIPTSINERASDAAHLVYSRLLDLRHEEFFDRRLRRQEADLLGAVEALLEFQGANFFVKHPHTDLYTMAFDNHDEWNPEHARLLDRKSKKHRELAKAVIAKWRPINERGKRLFVGKMKNSN